MAIGRRKRLPLWIQLSRIARRAEWGFKYRILQMFGQHEAGKAIEHGHFDMLSFAGIEKTISEYGKRARDGNLQIADMQGGTFTISNGGVYGSLMSTPILNAPQSGILGMHKIQERPMAINGQVVIRPMMYLALSYDHRIVDGKEAVTFLVRVKENLEDPQRTILDL